MNWSLNQMPPWAWPVLWTTMTLGASYLVGHLANLLIWPNLRRLTRHTEAVWDDIVIDELSRRVPFWALLAGAWISLGQWVLRDGLRLRFEQALGALAGISVTLAAAAVMGRLVVAYQAKVAPDVPATALTKNLARFGVVVLGVLMIAEGLRFDITAALTALGVGGLAVALALQEPLSNLFAGVFTSLAGQVRVGDYVKLESGEEGFIVDMDWRSTRIRMLGNSRIIVPNSKLSQSIITNYGLEETEMSVVMQVGVDYASDLSHVERVTIEVAREVMHQVEGGVPTHDPFIHYHTFGDSAIGFSVVLRARQFTDQFLVKHEFVKRLHARYALESINIPFPIRTLTSREPLKVVSVPPDSISAARRT